MLNEFFKIGLGIKQARDAKKINPQDVTYQTSPYAKQQLGMAQQLFNGRMAGATQEEQNIYGSQANFMDTARKNATDSSQLLALAGQAQGRTNEGFNALGVQESQNKYNMLDNLNRAYQTMTSEGDKVYNDQLRKYQRDYDLKQQLGSSGMTNIYGGLTGMTNAALQAMGLGSGGSTGSTAGTGGGNSGGMFSGLFGKPAGGQQQLTPQQQQFLQQIKGYNLLP
jgi:hypothetical protein